MKRFWRDMATTDFTGDTSDWIAVLPLAAVEQHGPHLPVGVDAFIAEGLVDRTAAALGDDSKATFLPVQQVCKSNEHISFPGTLTIGWHSTIQSWIDIGESIARAGVRKLIMITSHGGNNAPMEIAARELRQSLGMLVVTTSWGKLGKWQEIYDYRGTYTDIHAGLSETSLMMALRPDLVDTSKQEGFSSAQTVLKETHEHLGYHSSNANISWLSEDLNSAGAVGDASIATAELGEREITSILEGFNKLIEEVEATNAP
ncbi:MAG: creatininase family protein [Hyphomicrobiales bacterium]